VTSAVKERFGVAGVLVLVRGLVDDRGL